MIESAVTDLPEPDSPTIPSVVPASTENESPFTARTSPSSVLNVVAEVSNFEKRPSGELDSRERDERREDARSVIATTLGDARDLAVETEPAAIGRLDPAADRAGEPLLFRRLNREQHDQRDAREDEDAGEGVRQPGRVLLQRRLRLTAGPESCCCSCC